MAKESDLKKIELKVSVNCCDGCKKKVKKALQSIEGVLKIEVDRVQPKVTVIGNVEPQILIKRLSKVGKLAQVLGHGNQNASAPAAETIVEKKSVKLGETMVEAAKPKENVQSKSTDQFCQRDDDHHHHQQQQQQEKQPKPSSDQQQQQQQAIAKPSSESNTRKDHDDDKDKGSKKEEEVITKMGNPAFPFPSQYALTIPMPVAMPCYAVPSYSYSYAYPAAPLPLPPQIQTGCGQEYYQQQPPIFHTPTTRVGDYFSDENTLGCSVM